MSAFHGEQTSAQGIHTLTAWEHVDIAARNAGTYAAGDVGKVSRVGTGVGPFNFYILKDATGPITDANWDDVGTSTGSTVAPLTGRLYVDRTYAGPAASDGSIAAPFTTIQDAVNACNLGGAATPAEEEAQSWLVVIAGGYYDEALALPEKRSIWLQGAAGVWLSDGTSNRPVTIPGTVLPSSNVPYTYTFENIIFTDTVTVTSGVALSYNLSFRSCVFFDPAGTAVGPAVDGTGWVGGNALRVYAEKSVLRAFDGNYAIQLVGDAQNTAVGMDECQLEGGITCAGYGRMRSCQFGNGPSGNAHFDFNAAGLGLTAVTLSNVERPVGVFDSQFAGTTQFNDASVAPNDNLYVDNVSDKSFSNAGGTFGADTTATHPLWNASAGGPPTGAAGGDLGSNYPDPTVTAVHSGANQLAIANGLASDEVLVVNGAGTSITGSALTNFGDLSGPAGAADTALAVFDGVTGKLIKDVATTTLEDTTGPKLKLAAAATAGHNAQIILDAGTVGDKAALLLSRAGVEDWYLGVTGTTDLLWADGGGVERLKLTATGALTVNQVFTLPVTDGALDQVIKTDGVGNLSWTNMVAGGDVSGPGAGNSTDQALVRWNGTTGTVIQDSSTLLGNAGLILDGLAAGAGNSASVMLRAFSATEDSLIYFNQAATTVMTAGVYNTDPFDFIIWNGDPKDPGTEEVFKVAPTGAVTFNEAYTFPTTDGSSSGEVLTTDSAGNVTWATPAGGGDVVGPGAGNSTDEAIVRWDSTTGALVQNSKAILSDGATDLTLTLSQAALGGGHDTLVHLDHGGGASDLAVVTFATGGTSKGLFGLSGQADELVIQDSAGNERFTFGTEAAGTPGVLRINNAFSLPSADGNINEVLTTDGVGNVTWAAPAGGGTVTSSAASTVATQLALMTTDTNIYNAPSATIVGAELALDSSALGVGHPAGLTLKSGASADPATLTFEDGAVDRWSIGVVNSLTTPNLQFTENATSHVVMSLGTTGHLTLGELGGGTEFTLPDTRGAALEVLQTDGAGNVTWAAVAGTGDVVGPGPGVTPDALVRWDTNTGTLVKDSYAVLTDAQLTLGGVAAADPASLTLSAGTTADAALNINAGSATNRGTIAFKQAGSLKMALDVAISADSLGILDGSSVERFNFSPLGVLTINPAAADHFAFPSGDGAVDQILQTDGAGAVTWQDPPAGGGGTLQDAYDAGNTITTSTGTDIDLTLSTAGGGLNVSGAAASDGTVLFGIGNELLAFTVEAVSIGIASSAGASFQGGSNTLVRMVANDVADRELAISAANAAAGAANLTIDAEDQITVGGTNTVAPIIQVGAGVDAQILNLVQAGAGGESFGLFAGTADPDGTVSATAGSLFVRDTGGGASLHQNTSTGSGTAWTEFSTGGTGDVSGPGAAVTDTSLVRWNGVTGTSVVDSEATLTNASSGSLDLTLNAATAGQDVAVVLDHGGAAADSAFLVLQSGGVKRSQIGLLGDGATTLPGITVQDDAGNTNLTVTYEADAPVAGLHTTVATVDASGYVAGSIASLVVDGGPQGSPGLETHATLEFKQAGVAGFHFLSRMGGAHTTPTLLLRSGFGDDVLQLDATAAGAPEIIINGSDLGGDRWYLPTVDGTAGQVLTTDGTHNAGGVAWQDPAAGSSNVEILKADFAFDSAGGMVTVIPDLAVGDVVLQVWVRYTTDFNSTPSTIEVGNTGSVDAYFGASDTDPTDITAGFSTEPVDLVTVGPSPADVIVTITPDGGSPSTQGAGFVCVLVHRA